MNKLVIVVSLFLLACDAPSAQEVKDECTQVVKDGLATCTQDAWALCDRAYGQIMMDMQKENDALKMQIQMLSNQVQAGCDTYLNGYMADWLHARGCVWEQQSQYGWVCYGGQLCQPYTP